MYELPVHTRRDFIARGLTLLSGVATVPAFIDATASSLFAAEPDAARGKKPARRDDQRILVVVQLAGGNDGLNTVVPYTHDAYYRARPRIAIAKQDALKLNDKLGLHPAATGMKQLFDDGLLSIVQGVGYPNPDRSHFVATDIWSTASPNGQHHEGWIGRFFDCTCSGKDPCDPRLGIALTTEAPLALQGRRFSPVSFDSPDQLSWRGPDGSRAGQAAFEALNEAEEVPKGADRLTESGALAFLQRTAMDARASARQIQQAAGGGGGRAARLGRSPVGGKVRRNGGQLGQQLAMVHRMIAADLPTRVYYVSLGGFDTHAGQLGRHQQLMTQLGDALVEFVDALKNDGLLDRVLIMTFSEFGRRVAENASQGTDHGAAAPLFVVGSGVQPGLIGQHPSLDPNKLDRGDVKWQIDFRAVYATVLQHWLGANARQILGGTFAPIKLLKK